MRFGALKQDGKVVIAKCFVAKSFWSRLRGLMGRASLANNEAIFFPRCNSIHTCFMRFDLDVVHIDSNGNIVFLFESLKPWRMTRPRRQAAHTIECAPGTIRRLGWKPGVHLELEGGWV